MKIIVWILAYAFASSALAAPSVTVTVKNAAQVQALIALSTETSQVRNFKIEGVTIEFAVLRVNDAWLCYQGLRIVERDFFSSWNVTAANQDFCRGLVEAY